MGKNSIDVLSNPRQGYVKKTGQNMPRLLLPRYQGVDVRFDNVIICYISYILST